MNVTVGNASLGVLFQDGSHFDKQEYRFIVFIIN